jgi:orotate phosphoribosyltransferase
MDETTRRIIEKIIVRYEQPKTLPNGVEVRSFYDCASLTGNELARLAAQATGHLSHDVDEVVVGVAYSGIFFASAVAGGRRMSVLQKDGELFGALVAGKKVVVVDDVVCTGKSLRFAASLVVRSGGILQGYAVVVDRLQSPGHLDGLPVWSAYQDSVSQGEAS